ncbi:ABC transporter permease, partial [bacterium]|nr:ABC transporter permease [bacterium]
MEIVPKEYFKIAIKNLRARRLRSWLTILGIVIGVFLIVALLSLSEGLKMTILQELRMMGENVIMVFPGELNQIMTTLLGGMELEDEEIRAIEKVKGVEIVIPMAWKGENMRYGGKTKTVLLYGYPRKEAQDLFKTDLGWKLTAGSWPKPGKREIIVGKLVPEEFFPGLEPGDKVNIKGREFLVTGILKSLGSKQDDSMVGLDLEIFREITGKKKGAQFAFVKVKSNFSPEEVANKIKEKLQETQKRKGEKEEISFSILTNEKAGSIAGNILNIIQVMVFVFASIAILVGGIGITNTMFTSVRER